MKNATQLEGYYESHLKKRPISDLLNRLSFNLTERRYLPNGAALMPN